MMRVVGLVETALRAVAALCLAVLTTLVVAQVFLRYGLGSVPFFTEEVARYAMIWMALLATAVGVREASHIRVDFVPTALGVASPPTQLVLEAVLDVISLTAFLVLLWYGIDMTIFAAGQTSDGLRISLSYPYAAVPVAFFFASAFAILRLVEKLRQP
ncbi:TRAP transporter small permease [Chelativorans sp.]|uniref:TRAP transporter small permease n=1 Tax=Chelativorans sp. TaxID=2203393 RepID=UPI0028121612|nr:TRAP transporter small permease [Chelativorans sp.]